MTRLTQLSLLLALGSALGSALGCGDTTPVTTNQLNFDRPVDMAFACHGGLRITGGAKARTDQDIAISAMPTSGCEARAAASVEIPTECWPIDTNTRLPTPTFEPATPFGQENLRDGCKIVSQVPIPSWYGLVLETGPGVVNVVQFDVTQPAPSDSDLNQAVLDSDPLTPGTNGISIGEEPVAIVTDPAGCHAITANAGSCDLSVLNLDSALDDSPGAQVDRLTVTNASGAPILARPAAMVGESSRPPEDVGKQSCDQVPNPTGLVYVAYPSCHLVAGVDTSTGKIVAGIQYNAAGIPTIVDGNVTCPAECGGGGGGGGVMPGIRPVALTLEVDPNSSRRRLAIGADNSASITVVDLNDATRPMSLFQVALQNTTGALGVSKLSMSAEIGMGGGVFGFLDSVDDEAAGGTFQFVYAVATDGSVRVADVLDFRQECDTQVDPRYARKAATVHDLSCFPVGAPTTPPRRAGARGPGIRLPGDVIPLSVEFVRVDNLTTLGLTETRGLDFEKPTTLVGYFAVVTASNGSVFVVNVDDDDYPDQFVPSKPLSVPIGLAMAHQLRDAGIDRNFTIDNQDQKLDPCVHPAPGDPEYDPNDPNNASTCIATPSAAREHSDDDLGCDYLGGFQGTIAQGGPRITDKPDRKVPDGTVATEKLGLLPGLRQLLCDRRASHGAKATATDLQAISELQYAAPDSTRDVAFPDLLALPDAETWNLIWEGPLSLNVGNSNVNGPEVRESLLKVDAFGLHVLDDSRPFCDTGVEPFDLLELRGCDPTVGSADCPAGYTCFVHPKSTLGFGSCMLSGEADRLANACQDFLTSSRHYTVSTAASGELLALPRRFALRTTPLDGCTGDAQCQTLVDYAAREKSADPLCGDGLCDLGRETMASCPADCLAGPVCGDGRCEGKETRDNCPTDCPADHHQEWSCVADPLRAPMGGTGKRCELTCSTTDDCASGTVCQGGFCMEGVIPPQSCINASQRYELHAGDAFSVLGSRTGFVHPIIADANGKCVRDPQANRLSIGRLPLVAGPCDPTADPLTGQLPNGTFEPNPCLTTVTHDESVPVYDAPAGDGRCAPRFDDQHNAVLEPRERSAPAVRFRNRGMTFTLVDPHYPGDARCTTDLQGNLGQIPHVVPGYTLTFRQAGGFVPMQVLQFNTPETRPSLPVKVVRGPTNTLWVVDEGDFLSTSTVPSTRGKIFRIQPLLPGGGLPLQ